MINNSNVYSDAEMGLYSNVPAYWRNNLPIFIGINEELNPETNEPEQIAVDVKTMGHASKHDAATWSSFDEALYAKRSGLVQKIGIATNTHPLKDTLRSKGPVMSIICFRSTDGSPLGSIPVIGYAEKSADGKCVIEIREGEHVGHEWSLFDDHDNHSYSRYGEGIVALEGRCYQAFTPSQFGVPAETDSDEVNLLDYLPSLAVGLAGSLNAECSSSAELSWLLNNLANSWGYRRRYTPSEVGQRLSRLVGADNVGKVGDVTVSRQQRRVKKKCGDGGSQLQTVYSFIKTPPSVSKDPVYSRNKIDHPLFEYSRHPSDVIDLDPYYSITSYRGCQYAGVAIERDPCTKEPIRKLYVDLYTAWGASADDSDTLSTLEFAVWALNNSPKIEYIACLPKPGDDLSEIDKINAALCPIDMPVVSKPTYKEVLAIDPIAESYYGVIPSDPEQVVGSIVEAVLHEYPERSLVNLKITKLTNLLNECHGPCAMTEFAEDEVDAMLSKAFTEHEHIIIHGITVPGMRISRKFDPDNLTTESSASATYTFERLVTS